MASITPEKTLLIEIMADNLTGREADQLELSFSLGLFEKLELMGFTTASSKFSPFSGPGRLAVSISHVLFTPPGQALSDILGDLLEAHLSRLETPARPRRRESAAVLKLTSLVLLHGDQVISVTVRGLQAGRTTHGHLLLGRPAIELAQADDYKQDLYYEGRVLAGRERRIDRVQKALDILEKALDVQFYRTGSSTGMRMSERSFDREVRREEKETRHDDFDILHDRAAEVEFPEIRLGQFHVQYLNPGKMPPELLDALLRGRQLLPMRSGSGRLRAGFAVIVDQAREERFVLGADLLSIEDLPGVVPVANIEQQLAEQLAMACQQFSRERELSLGDRVHLLARLPFIGILGSQADRLQRVGVLAAFIAGQTGDEIYLVERVARLFLQDLSCTAVSTYPHLHGVLGKYLKDENRHYLPNALQASVEAARHPRHADDDVPSDRIGAVVALADKLDTLIAHFAAGHEATRHHSPYGMHIDALAIGRLLLEHRFPVELPGLINEAKQQLGAPGLDSEKPYQLIMDRLGKYLHDARPYRNWPIPDAKLAALMQAKPQRLDRLLDEVQTG